MLHKIGNLILKLLPLVVFAGSIYLWDRIVVWNEIEPFILPRPMVVIETIQKDWPLLSQSLLNTLTITFSALGIAAVGGLLLAIIFTQSRVIEACFFPFAVILQVTPIIAVAPLIFIYVESVTAGLILCAFIVAFFPVLSNTTVGLRSVDHNLEDLFKLYGASRFQVLMKLKLPSALPYYLSGLRIAGGLALIGAIVAEFTAGTAGSESGLAYRILESGYRLNIPRLFAALVLIALTGIAIYLTLAAINHLMLRRWHESAIKRDR